MRRIFVVGGVYGLALSVLVLSHLVSWQALNVFLAPGYDPGGLSTVWMNWHAIGCAFVGVTSLLASRSGWSGAPRRGVGLALAGIYAIWGLQNAWLCVATDHFTVLMWLHTAACLICGGWYAAWLRFGD